jgi:hypothetical protein
MKQFLTRFLIAGLLTSSLLVAQTYKIHVVDKVQVGSTQLTPGGYLLEVDGANAVLKDKAGNTIDSKAKVEQTSQKAPETSLEVNTATQQLTAITPGGSRIRVVFE